MKLKLLSILVLLMMSNLSLAHPGTHNNEAMAASLTHILTSPFHLFIFVMVAISFVIAIQVKHARSLPKVKVTKTPE